MKLRRAAQADVAALVDRWAEMFEELGSRDASPAAADADLRAHFRRYLQRKLGEPDFAAWVIDDGKQIICTGSVILYEIPGRADVTHEAYVINVYTLPAFRGRGLARQLMEELLAHVKTLPVRKVWLRTAPKAKTLYERSGFRARPEFMELDIKQG
ncbi:MAG: GNAT family N-acetyltransferase [Deltaproteobacteria bacterium]|nr:GNAT family N-acetyltransferase [Deltaproteobacteria bacterium]